MSLWGSTRIRSLSHVSPCRWKYVIDYFWRSTWALQHGHMNTDQPCGGHHLLRPSTALHFRCLFGYSIDILLWRSSLKLFPSEQLGEDKRIDSFFVIKVNISEILLSNRKLEYNSDAAKYRQITSRQETGTDPSLKNYRLGSHLIWALIRIQELS